jgi:hypothetical protein
MNVEPNAVKPQEEAKMAQEQLESVFAAVGDFFNWYESNGELKAGIPATVLEPLYLSLHVFNNYATRVSLCLDRNYKKWERVSSIRTNGVNRGYLKLGIKDAINANIHLVGLFTKSVGDRSEVSRAITILQQHEQDDIATIKDAEKMLTAAKQAFEEARQAYDDAHSQVKTEAFNAANALDSGSSNGEDDDSSISELRNTLNEKTKEYHSFRSVLRQRKATLEELQYGLGLLERMAAMSKAINTLLLQSIDVIRTIAEAEEKEGAFLEVEVRSVAEHYQEHVGEEMDILHTMNHHLKQALRAL